MEEKIQKKSKPLKLREKILKNLDEELWNLETVAAVVETKKSKRNKKGQILNTFVLTVDHEKNGNEFDNFITALKEHINDFKDKTRIQLTVLVGDHWYPLDIEIKNNNLSVIIPEAGFSPGTGLAAHKILEKFPDAEIYRFYPETHEMGDRKRTYMIQVDDNSCSRFSLQQLFSLAEIDNIHEELRKNQKKLNVENLGFKKDDKHYSITFSHCPAEIASIFQSTQSVSALNLLDDAVKQYIINEKGETLEQFHQRHTRANPDKNMIVQNLGIMDFKKSRINSTIEFLDKKKINEKKLLSDRTGIKFLVKGQDYRDHLNDKQIEKMDKKMVKEKNKRNLILEQVNELCREETNAINDILKVLDKNEVASNVAKDLNEKIENIRIEIMAYNPKKNLLNYKKYLDELQRIDSNVKKLQSIYHIKLSDAGIDLNSTKKIDYILEELYESIGQKTIKNSIKASYYKEQLSLYKTEHEKDDDNDNKATYN